MRFSIRLGLAFATSVALVAAAAPAAFASSSTTKPAPAAHIVMKNGRPAIAIPLRPGKHTISEQVRLSARFHSGATPSSAPTIKVRVGPGQCAGYNGEINWVYFPNEEVWLINTYGVMWDNCWKYYSWPSTAYVYVSYNELDEPRQNFQAFSVHDAGSGGISQGVNSGEIQTADIFGPSAIKVTACLQSLDGWQCGASQSL